MGFGKMESGDSATTLQEAQVQYISNNDCDERYQGNYLINDGMMCAFSVSAQDACQGDSGGPLLRNGGDSTGDLAVGIVSWGVGCGINPGVYSRISKFREWIEEVVQQNGGVMCGKSKECDGCEEGTSNGFKSGSTVIPSSVISVAYAANTTNTTSTPVPTINFNSNAANTTNTTSTPVPTINFSSNAADDSSVFSESTQPTYRSTLNPTFAPKDITTTPTASFSSQDTYRLTMSPTFGPENSVTAVPTDYPLRTDDVSGFLTINGVSVPCDGINSNILFLFCRFKSVENHCPKTCNGGRENAGWGRPRPRNE